ncbi:unnamed protein product [Kuraishia capsulata CBS 1993]|uniref:ABC1 atypical kinase-like domain-containing protein n=1 Tax=Kuraishia capsulata CBS 1993 TaxID=1382522 RepID=W6MQP8_9ASCO|nr:uncharacterized protein KUCA_T00003565001 [Kuraishia capsulata CBS 1993]CDK27587.1 unnamed protein product [Kuraishia capsulata CBS 1993]
MKSFSRLGLSGYNLWLGIRSASTARPNPIFQKKSLLNAKVVGVVSGLGALAFGGYIANDGGSVQESTGHAITTAERIAVVSGATVKCFLLYGRALNKTYDSDKERELAMSECHKEAAEITLKALETNGGIYIKLGQHVSAMTYLLPLEWTDTMIPLQSQCPESSLDEIRQMFKTDMGVELEEYFEEFETKPVGVASLAQVHVGVLKSNGKKVAIKFQHPSLDEFVPLDILMTNTVFNLMATVFPEYPLTWLGDELQSSIYVELDFVNEAKNARKTAAYFSGYKGLTALRIPEVYDAHRRVLIMEYVSGARMDDIKYMDNNHISRAQVSSCLSHIFNNMIFTPGVGVHCDPHGGNLAIRAVKKHWWNFTTPHNFEIILYDHGLYRDIPQKMRREYARFWLAMLDKDQDTMKKYAKKFANINDQQFPVLAAAITGRDFDHALNGGVTTTRGDAELERMKESLVTEGLFVDLMSLLATVPRIVLLILKTNDLTRHLDESLQNPLGPERTFLILATYCASTVYAEDLEENSKRRAFSWLKGYVRAWSAYHQRSLQLWMYDGAMILRNLYSWN